MYASNDAVSQKVNDCCVWQKVEGKEGKEGNIMITCSFWLSLISFQ
jgi:hypothetical protein